MGKQRRSRAPSQARDRGTTTSTVEVEIERILPGGLGLAHAGGKTLLVALAAPGDRVRVRIERVRGAVAFASIEEVITPSAVRVAPPCPYFGRCGGCDFQQLTYQAQLGAKVEIVRDCLQRIARLTPPAHIPITPAPDPWHYRSRAQWQYDPRRELLGYYERGSHNVCDVVECPVVVPALQEKLTALREEMMAGRLPQDVGEFQAAAGDDGATLSPPLGVESQASREAVETEARGDAGEGDGAARERRADDERESLRTIGGERYRFNAECFFQINHELLAPLILEATREASGGATAVDLYCGVGLFTLPLARRFARVVAVEGNPASCLYARRNLADAGLMNARVEASSVSEWLMRHAAELAPVDFVLLDPPRAGADDGALEGIIALEPRRISYVSCDPATFARDLKILNAHGFRLDSLMAFDMFPQTHHVELVGQLLR
ncbi:MAG TPA: class I SAM-dependent RNA methyltransferase [Pyrinomonadaceae bacterium]|jgi:23S rRNA (uracil1939-C5)-methyltransferase